MKSSLILGGLVAFAAVQAQVVLAEDQPQATTSVQTAAPSVLDSFAVSYWGASTVTSIKDPLNANQINETGDKVKDKFQFLDNSLFTGYKFSDTIVFGPEFNFAWQPVVGQDLKLEDPSLKLVNKKIYSNGGFNLSGSLRYYLPVTTKSRDNSLYGQIRPFAIAAYEIPGTKFTVGSYAFLRAYLYSNKAPKSVKTFEAYLGPNVGYQVTKTLAFTALYELDAEHGKGDKDSFDLKAGGGATDLEIGAAWDFIPAATFMPYIQLQTGDKVTWQSTSVGFNLSAKFL